MPLVYLVCTDDEAFGKKKIQDTMLDRVVRERFMIARCDTGHFPFWSRPDVAVGVIREAAGETVGGGLSGHLEWSQTSRSHSEK